MYLNRWNTLITKVVIDSLCNDLSYGPYSFVHAVSAGEKSGSVLYALHLNNHQRKAFILLILKFRLTYNATFTKIKIIPFLKWYAELCNKCSGKINAFTLGFEKQIIEIKDGSPLWWKKVPNWSFYIEFRFVWISFRMSTNDGQWSRLPASGCHGRTVRAKSHVRSPCR